MNEEQQLELENRIKNLVWTVSGDYTLNLKPDTERYMAGERDTVLYDTVRQGAFAKYFDREAFSMYLVKKVYLGAAERELMLISQMVVEEAVSSRLEEERPGVRRLRLGSYEEILDQAFSSYVRNPAGQLKMAYIRKRKEPEYVPSGALKKTLEIVLSASGCTDTMDLVRITDRLYNELAGQDFVKRGITLEQVLAVTVEELTEYSWKDFLSEDLYEDALETYLKKVSEQLTNFDLMERKEDGGEEKENQPKKKIVVVDEKALAQMYSYVEKNYGRTYLNPTEEKSRNYQLCRGIHSDCSLYYTEGILKAPVVRNYQLAYAKKQKDKNIHAYHEDHRAVKQNIRTLKGMLKKALVLREETTRVASDHGKIKAGTLWKAGRCENAELFEREIKHDALDFVVDVLIDASGSQRVRQSQVALQGYILAEALCGLAIPCRVMSFCTFWDYTILHRMRDYDDPAGKNSDIFEYCTSSNNRDGLAVKAVGWDLLKRDESRKLLIVLSDGKPYDVLVNRPNARNPKPYRDRTAVLDTATEVRRLRQQGAAVLGVFAGRENELAAERMIFGKDFAYIREIEHFSNLVGRYLQKQIEE